MESMYQCMEAEIYNKFNIEIETWMDLTEVETSIEANDAVYF